MSATDLVKRPQLSRWVEHRAEWGPGKVAVRFEGGEITYAELERRVRRLAVALDGKLHVRAGDRIAYLGLNSPEILDLLFACARLGAILMPLNWRLAPAEHGTILAHATPKALFVEPEFRAHVETIGAEIGAATVGYRTTGGGGWLGYEELLDACGDGDAAASAPGASPVLLVYTSGTTGRRPKGVLLSQQALFWNAVNSIAANDMTSADHVLTVLPMFHVGGLNIHTTPAIHAGARVTIHRRFDPARALEAIAADRPTLFLAVPQVSLAMTSHPGWSATDVSSLRLVATGSSTVPEAVIRPWLERGVPVTQVYGLTESAPVAICLPPADAERKIGSCGKPVLHCEARVVDDAGRDVLPLAHGEIWLRGPNLFAGYWNDPAATAEACADGWLRTGDIGHRDADGYFWIDDRKKDVVISGGEKIYPAELESVLADCPSIVEAAVVGRPDDRWGEVPVAFVVPTVESELTAEVVVELFARRLARFKHPREIVFLERLPRNVMGKVLKDELRARLAGGVTTRRA